MTTASYSMHLIDQFYCIENKKCITHRSTLHNKIILTILLTNINSCIKFGAYFSFILIFPIRKCQLNLYTVRPTHQHQLLLYLYFFNFKLSIDFKNLFHDLFPHCFLLFNKQFKDIFIPLLITDWYRSVAFYKPNTIF